LFAVLPDTLAWVTNQVAVDVVAAAGMVTLLRLYGRSWTAAGLGAAAFTYGGFVAMHSEHLDVVQAAGLLVWAFVAVDRLARRPSGRPAGPWMALLGLSLGLMLLTGAAEPVLDGGVALAIYAGWLVWKTRGRRLVLSAEVVGGAMLGALIGAAQLVPGSALQGHSQRALHTYMYFTSGSMNKSFTLLGLDPLLLGGGHSWPLSFVGTYNLPEISSYVGILPVMAVVGLLARRHRRSPEARQWWIWYVIGAVGLVLAWGSFTPLGHLEYLVPFYDRQRLLARNLLEVDLAATVLFAAWVDHMLLAQREPAGGGARRSPFPARADTGSTAGADSSSTAGRRRTRWSSDVALPLVPPIAVVGLQVVLVAGGPWFPHFLHVPGPVSYSNLWPLGAFLTVPTALALGAAWLVVRGPRLGRATVPLVAALLAADLLVFNVVTEVYPPSPNAAGQSATADALAGVLSAAGTGPGDLHHRMALFDPDRFYPNEVNALGQPDLTVLRGLSSVQGYGAVVDAGYDTATGAHLQGYLALPALTNGTLAGLDLGVFVTVPEYFVHEVVAPPSAPRSTIPGATPLPPVPADRSAGPVPAVAPPTPDSDYQLVPEPPAWVALVPGHVRTWYFGTVLAVGDVELPLRLGDTTPGTAQLRVGLLSPDGSGVEWRTTVPVSAGATSGPVSALAHLHVNVVVHVPGAPSAAGLVIEQMPGGPSGPQTTPAVGAALVSTAGQGTYRVDGSLRDVIDTPDWRFDRTIGPFAVFSSDRASGRAWLDPGSAGTAHVLSSPPWGVERIEVRCDEPAVLVRDVAFATGWQAAVSPAPGVSGPARGAAVVRHGLVQAVAVPAGTHVVTFRYRAHRLFEGLAGSGAGVLLAAGLVISGRRWNSRRGNGGRGNGERGKDERANRRRRRDAGDPGAADR
jgi:hypothetical protein